MRHLIGFICFFIFNHVYGQYTISGVVTNEKGEKLSFTTVYIEGIAIASSTDEKGIFKLHNVAKGSYTIKATFIGYRAYQNSIQISSDTIMNITLRGEIYNLDMIEIQASRVGKNAPFSHLNLDKKTLEKENLGQDVPYLLQWTPSLVVTSDAGTGIGYTSLRIRGSDQTRINVTINGVPLNDAESHNVFWVDLPDLIGSVSNIQIQRGIGTSTNGAGAFGCTVSVNTTDIRVNPYLDASTTFGQFNTKKLSINAGTGLINNRYLIDARYSIINSDGYTDRASADLQSFSFSAARISSKSSLRFNVLQGKEITYQAWYGVPVAKLNGNNQQLTDHYFTNLGSIYHTHEDSINLFDSDRRYNYYTYPNQVDNYKQTHLQLIHSYAFHRHWKTKTTLYYTKGKGYFEEYKHNDHFSDYLIPNVLDSISGLQIDRSNIVRRRWLDNDLIGIIVDGEYSMDNKWIIQSGFAANTYLGDHFGNVIKSSIAIPNFDIEKKYYKNHGNKRDISTYIKSIYEVNTRFQLHGDLQLRFVDYAVSGVDNDLRNIKSRDRFTFFNPKVGAYFHINDKRDIFVSLAVGHKEPSRGDYIDNIFGTIPRPEKLINWEAGYKYRNKHTSFETNLYFMDYKDQLVLTGKLNDVGAPVRINVPESYRLGLESSIVHQLSKKWNMLGNITISRNKIESFDEIIPDYTINFDEVIVRHLDKDIAFSPSFIGALQLGYQPHKSVQIEWSLKQVSRQYLDNTQNIEKSLSAYHFQNLSLSYHPRSKFWKHSTITLLCNNILNQKYSTNGYTYSYIYERTITENYVYPQAGRNVLAGLKISF